jgi:hypothetical protein
VRELADEERIRRFMRALGAAASDDAVCYLVGGATAVLLGWRSTTVDIDVKLEPERNELLRALPSIKEELEVNVELASPAEFIPLPEGWRERSPSAGRERHLTFRHFDLYSQALAKLERGHAQDVDDAREMLARGLIERERLRSCFLEIEPELYRFPAIHPAEFGRSVEEFVGS